VRGTTLEDILLSLSDAWNELPESLPDSILSCIPSVP
jgi:hypothetical protein